MVAVSRAPPVSATLTSGVAAEKSREVWPPRAAQVRIMDQGLVAGGDGRPGHPLAGRVGDPDLIAAVDVDVLDLRVAQVAGQRAEAVALVVDGLGQGLAVARRRHQAAAPDLPLGPQPHRVPMTAAASGSPTPVVEPAGDLGQDLGHGPRAPRVGQRGQLDVHAAPGRPLRRGRLRAAARVTGRGRRAPERRGRGWRVISDGRSAPGPAPGPPASYPSGS